MCVCVLTSFTIKMAYQSGLRAGLSLFFDLYVSIALSGGPETLMSCHNDLIGRSRADLLLSVDQ